MYMGQTSRRPTLPPKVVPTGIPRNGEQLAQQFNERLRYQLKGYPPTKVAFLVSSLATAWDAAMSAHAEAWRKPAAHESDTVRYLRVHTAAAPRLREAAGKEGGAGGGTPVRGVGRRGHAAGDP